MSRSSALRNLLFALLLAGAGLPPALRDAVAGGDEGASPSAALVELRGTIVDSVTGSPLAARVYLRHAEGRWLFVESASPDEGSALPYREEWVPIRRSVERHTTVSAHPFRARLAPGTYTVTIERGKEYRTLSESLVVPSGGDDGGDELADSRGTSSISRTFRLVRWIDMASRGWFSGETHVHRRIHELPNVMLAEDLNVAFPVTFWTINAFEKPGLAPSPLRRQGPSPFGPRVDRGHAMIPVDSTHVIFPRNTEYEVFSIDGKRHTLGALFILNHKTVFQEGMPPVAKIAELAHREGALLDLDKHSWPWSMMLVPIAKVDLFELSNNSVWRTEFGFRHANAKIADSMKVERASDGLLTEWGWLEFGFQNYYALLNCGFRLQPTAGTASGVHPVPLGWSRVYVHTGNSFDAKRWLDGLRHGRSFVTTGPMLLATVDGKLPGEVFRLGETPRAVRLAIESRSESPIDRVEVILNGEIVRSLRPPQAEVDRGNDRGNDRGDGVFTTTLELEITEPSWIAVRSIEPRDGGRRKRFAHTAPWHFEFTGRQIRPRRVEVEYLIERVSSEVRRNDGVLPEASLAEFREALRIYKEILSRARD